MTNQNSVLEVAEKTHEVYGYAPYLESRQVADMIQKRHKNLLRDINEYIAEMEKLGEPKTEPSSTEPCDNALKIEGVDPIEPSDNGLKEEAASKLRERQRCPHPGQLRPPAPRPNHT